MIYFDYAANSPVNKEVLKLYNELALKYYANPNSSHKLGVQAKKKIEQITKDIAKILGVKPNEIIYTSGATEANNLAIKGITSKYSTKKRIITTPLEHSSIIAPCSYLANQGYEVVLVDIDEKGIINLNHFKELLNDNTVLVSINMVDSEVGIKQPIKAIREALKDYPDCFFHSDATQAIGKMNIDFSDLDLVTFAPHKFYGLNGIGILIKKEHISLTPIIHGGKSTTIYRAGTPMLPDIGASLKAIKLAINNFDKKEAYVKELNSTLREGLSKYPLVHINSPKTAIPFVLNFSIKGVKGHDVAKELEKYDIYVSTKSACSSDASISSSVYALTKDEAIASGTIRVSLSYLTKRKEVTSFLKAFDKIYKKLT